MQQIQLQLRAAENRSLCNPKLGAFKKRKKEKKKKGCIPSARSLFPLLFFSLFTWSSTHHKYIHGA
jgi:hypothetical protein